MTSPFTIITRTQFEQVVYKTIPSGTVFMNRPLFEEMKEAMWRLIDSHKAEFHGYKNGSFIYGFDGIPTGVLGSETYAGKDGHGGMDWKSRLTISSPYIRKQRGTAHVVKSNSAKGLLSRLSASDMKAAPLNVIFPVKDMVKTISQIGTHSPKPSYPSLESAGDLLDCVDSETGQFCKPPTKELLDWVNNARNAKRKAEKAFEWSETTRDSFQKGFLVFANIHDARLIKRVLMFKVLFKDNLVNTECVDHRWIDSIQDIGEEYPHVLGINNLMRMSTEEKYKSGLVLGAEYPQLSLISYSYAYGVILGGKDCPLGLGSTSFAAVPLHPISNDTKKEEEKKVDTATRQMSALFGE